MFTFKLLIALTLVCAVAVLSGCVTSGSGFACSSVVTKEAKAPAPEPKEKVVVKEVPGPERIVYRDRPVYSTITVTQEVPGPERVVVKEVPVEKEVQKPFFVLPGVFFDTDKSDIKPAGKKELDKAVKALAGAGNPAIIVSGHTDSVASDEYNQSLSERRSESVKAYLVSKGVPAGKVSTKGYGETKPIASNETNEGRAQNRRVEIDLANP